MTKSISPSRTYVAVCCRMNYGYYFKKFFLPERDPWEWTNLPYENNSCTAAWFFLNRLDGVACIEGCFSAEDFEGSFITIQQDEKGNGID